MTSSNPAKSQPGGSGRDGTESAPSLQRDSGPKPNPRARPGRVTTRALLSTAEIDRRVAELVARQPEVVGHRSLDDLRVANATELTAEQRARYGFGADWQPNPTPTGDRRRAATT